MRDCMERIWNWRGLSILTFVCSGLLCLLSVCLFLQTYLVLRPVTANPAVVESGAFRLEDRSADCGKVRIGQVVKHTFRLLNTSRETRRIVKVTPGCSCSKVDHFSKDVAPQSVGEVTVVIDTSGNPGIRQSSVLIETDDPKVPRLNPLVSCAVLPAVETRPNNLRFVPQESTATFPTQTIEVMGLYQDEKISLGNIQPSDPMIVVTKQTSKANKPLRFDVTVNEKMPAGLTLAHLIIHIDGSVQKSARFPMTIANELKIKAEPAMLEIPVDKDALQTAEFTVTTVDNSRLEVNKAELAGTALHAVPRQVADNAVTVRLDNLRMTHELDLKHICVSTNHGELRVPITVRARTKSKQ